MTLSSNYNRKTLRSIILFVGLLAMSASCSSSNNSEKIAKRPNFVWLVSEDNSAAFLRLYNQGENAGFGAIMPNVEKLAAKGLIFNNAFSNAPVCSTARTTLATGAYGPRIGTEFHRPYKLATMPTDLKPIGQLMQEAGYYTSNNYKNDFNFTETTKTTVWNDSSKTASWQNRKADQPFFHMQTWKDTHEHKLHFALAEMETHKNTHTVTNMNRFPVYPDTELFRYTMERYLDKHLIIDDKIGQVVQILADEGVLEDTFIFYFGDHGGVMPASKGYVFERGLQVPLVIRVPENFKHLLADDMQNVSNTRLDGFVNFIDFAPTLLKLAGASASAQHDGLAFLGKEINKEVLAKRDTAFSYADRFDEKYDLVRSIRKGNLKYIRSYQPYYPDGLFNEYRYKQAAYREWKTLFKQGKLADTQAAFFRPKSPERLYDIASDPDELNNLADDPHYNKDLISIRELLTQQIKSMPDLSFYPESFLVHNATDNPVAFGQAHKTEIATLIDIANLQLEPYSVVEKQLGKLLQSTDQWHRYWALIVLSSFGDQAESFATNVAHLLLNENSLLVKARAIEFLAIIDEIQSVKPLSALLAEADNDIVMIELLNIAAYLKESKGWLFSRSSRPDRHKKIAVRAFGHKMMDKWLDSRWDFISSQHL